jgi:UDP:flavonoid glycosyltransferase YjiC (YdhE family)
MTRRIRVLFVAEAVTLAHVARCAALARVLEPERFEVRTAWDSHYDHLVGAPDHSLWTVPRPQFTSALYRGAPIYREKDLVRYVRDDLTAIERFQPDVVVGDFRLSLGVSARLADVRYIAIANAYWSPHAMVRPPVPDTALTDLVGVRLGQRLFDRGTPAALAWHARVFRKLGRRCGLPLIASDIRAVYTEGDSTLYADIEELVPLASLPDGHRFLGPVPWSPDVEPPGWWSGLPAGQPIVYVSLGSSGRGELLSVILNGLASLPVIVLAATAGAAPPERIPANAYVAAALPGDRVAAESSVVIGNGGSPTTYQGLTAGSPVIGICGNLDQYLNMTLVAESGAGILLRSGRLSESLVRHAVSRALDDDTMRNRAGELAQIIAGYPTADRFKETIEEVCAGRAA